MSAKDLDRAWLCPAATLGESKGRHHRAAGSASLSRAVRPCSLRRRGARRDQQVVRLCRVGPCSWQVVEDPVVHSQHATAHDELHVAHRPWRENLGMRNGTIGNVERLLLCQRPSSSQARAGARSSLRCRRTALTSRRDCRPATTHTTRRDFTASDHISCHSDVCHGRQRSRRFSRAWFLRAHQRTKPTTVPRRFPQTPRAPVKSALSFE